MTAFDIFARHISKKYTPAYQIEAEKYEAGCRCVLESLLKPRQWHKS